ncbi:DUF3343 domain-containing protein [Candidatus Avoscillospira sp. LCP25S3_F1]|uniref:DUF3343 domain-containing protein n=1 Tax=Candidatus Avoscillospira sp. LCP25S3_F1 TaxID=3438825 RepID=UPI003F92B9F0
MYDCMIAFRTITRAQRGAELLDYSGIPCRLQRLPAALADRGCGYVLALRRESLARAVAVLRQNHVDFGRLYTMENGIHREVFL